MTILIRDLVNIEYHRTVTSVDRMEHRCLRYGSKEVTPGYSAA